MNKLTGTIAASLMLAALLTAPGPARAELVEEIVAWVNGEIITMSELEEEEQAMMSEIYRRFTGEELDEQMRRLREELLIQLIDRKILLSKAQTMFDIDAMGEVFYEGFMEQQNINDEAELEAALAREGMTVEDLKRRLVENFAPDEVLRHEVGSRVAVTDKEMQQYYADHPDDFVVPAEVTIREIVLLANDEEVRAQRRPEAEEIQARAVAAEDFAALAREVSEAGTQADGGQLGPLKKGELSEQLEEIAFGLPVGEVSELLEMPYGFHIIKIETRSEETIAPIEEIGEQLRRWLEDRKFQEQREAYLEKARAEAEWCVKPKYADRLPEQIPNQSCQSL
jgi:peptidyl-prolyl cis-trans isomerase SurA